MNDLFIVCCAPACVYSGQVNLIVCREWGRPGRFAHTETATTGSLIGGLAKDTGGRLLLAGHRGMSSAAPADQRDLPEACVKTRPWRLGSLFVSSPDQTNGETRVALSRGTDADIGCQQQHEASLGRVLPRQADLFRCDCEEASVPKTV